MGQALASAFLRAGHATIVWNRTAAKAGQLGAQGAMPADSVSGAVAASPLVVVCVSDYHAVHEATRRLSTVPQARREAITMTCLRPRMASQHPITIWRQQ